MHSTASMIAGGGSFIFSAISLAIMSACPKVLIQISLLFSLICSLLIATSSFIYGSIVGGIFGVVFFLLSICYACLVWRRIPFAAANLTTGLTAVKMNGGVFLVAIGIVLLSFGYCLLWMTALVGVYDKLGLCVSTTENDGTTTTTCSEDDLAWGYFFLLLLAFFWYVILSSTLLILLSMDWVNANDTLTLAHHGILPVFIETQDGTSLSGERCVSSIVASHIINSHHRISP
jgi:hypothetical protein